MADFLTSLDILDTGFITVTNRTNQLATSYRVNSGSALRLKSVEFNIQATSSVDKSTTPGYYPSTLNSIPQSIKKHEVRSLVSINPTQITLRIILNSKNVDTTNSWGINDMSLLRHLIKLPHTPGFKALYYPVDNTATDLAGNTSRSRNQQIVYQLGETDTTESQGDIASSTLMTLWTGATSTAVGKDLTDVNYIPVRFESCNIIQLPDSRVQVTLSGVITG